MSVKHGLGRGFDSLIPTELLDESFDPTADQDEKISDLRQIVLGEIVADSNQPRRHFDEESLIGLAESIKKHGILQPIIVTPHKGKYMIVAGERRFRAAQYAKIEKIPALVRTLSDQHKLELSLIENLQRRDLNILETATAYLKLRDQFNLTLDEIGQHVGGKSTSAIANTLRLLRLPESVRKELASGRLREGQVRPLVGLDEDFIDRILPRILREEWSARVVEKYITQLKRGKEPSLQSTNASVKSHVKQYSQDAELLEKRFVSPVKIKVNARGVGQIVIPFRSQTEYLRISKILNE